MILVRRRAEEDQFPLVADFVEPEDVHAIVIGSDFDVAIAGSVPLIHDFYDVDPTPAPIKTAGGRSEIHMSLYLNAHDSTMIQRPFSPTGPAIFSLERALLHRSCRGPFRAIALRVRQPDSQ